jgi:hypothetical protein
VSLKPHRRRIVFSTTKAESLELAPEILQVIAVVAEIMLDHRRRKSDARKAA